MGFAISMALASAATALPADAEAAGVAVGEEEDSPSIVVTGSRAPVGTTGSKTDTPLRDVPASVSVISAATLADQEIRGFDAALANASAVAPVFAGGYGLADNYVIRGLPMRFLRDGLPDGASFNGYRRTLYDIATIEVLKGPGSAVYGRGEAGGTVNAVSRTPGNDWSFDALASYGRFDALTLSGALGGPLAPGIGAEIIANYERSDGYRGLATRFVDILPTAQGQLGDHAVTLAFAHREQRFTVDNYGIPFTVQGSLADVAADARFYSPYNFSGQTIDRITLADRFAPLSDLVLRAALIYDRRAIEFARNAGGNVLNAAGVMTGRNGRTQSDDVEYWTGQFEAVWSPTTGAIGHAILLGAEYTTARFDTVRRSYNLPNAAVVGGQALVSDGTAIPVATTLAFDRAISAQTLSMYGQDQLAIGDRIKLRGGVRVDAVKLVDEGLFGATAARIAGSDTLVSWQIGAVWQPTTAISLYAGYARGKNLAINTEAANLSSNFARRAAPRPESSSQIEAGFKLALLPGSLSLNGAVFETRRDDFFVTLAPGADPVQVGKQRSRGAELELTAAPLAGLTLTAAGAYVDATNLSGALVSIAGLAVNQPSFGRRLAATPEWSGNIWANYTVPAGALAGLTLGAGATARSAVFADALELLRVPGYTIVRAALGYHFGPVDAQVTIANLTDAAYYHVPTFSGALPGEPRSVQLSLRTAF